MSFNWYLANQAMPSTIFQSTIYFFRSVTIFHNNQVLFEKKLDDMNILKFLFKFLNYTNQTSVITVRKKYFDSVNSILNLITCRI